MTSTGAGRSSAALGRGARVLEFFRDIKVAHSIFALPFAFSAAVLAGPLSPLRIVQILLALFFARTSAMAFNRIADARIDAKNPRTASRALPGGRIPIGEYVLYFAIPTVLFVVVCATINRICFLLSPVALVVILGYPWTKRFTASTHFFLGLALAAAPIGAWIAVAGSIDRIAILLGAGVLFWTAGFDIIYACLDFEVDRREKIRSIPATLGLGPALWISAACHGIAVCLLAAVWATAGLGPASLAGVILIALLLSYEHWIVRPGDLSRLGTAFFTVNGAVSILFFTGVMADIALFR